MVIKALVEAAHDPSNGRGEIYQSTKAVIFFGTPNAGSNVDKKKRVEILKTIVKASFQEVPPKIESLQSLTRMSFWTWQTSFFRTAICRNPAVFIYSFYVTPGEAFGRGSEDGFGWIRETVG